MPEVTVHHDKRTQTWSVFIDGDMHLYGYCDRLTAVQAAQRLRAEITCEFSARRLNRQAVINQFLRSN